MNAISVVGCGWMGLPLAKQLIQFGYRVKGSVTRVEKLPLLRENGIEPYQLLLNPGATHPVNPTLWASEVLIVNIPPGIRKGNSPEHHLEQLTNLVRLMAESTIRKVIFVSSTSVYPDLGRKVSEEDEYYPPESLAGKTLRRAESIFQELTSVQTTVLRPAGLVGPNRPPGRFYAGKKDIPGGSAPVNLVHLDDVIGAIQNILEQNAWGGTYNLCATKHPTKAQFYTQAAQSLGLPLPQFDPLPATRFKSVDGSKISRELGFKYQHPDPMQWI